MHFRSSFPANVGSDSLAALLLKRSMFFSGLKSRTPPLLST